MDRAEKKCTTCGETKPRSEFYASRRSPDGRKYTCKECDREYSRKLDARKAKLPILRSCKGCGLRKPSETFVKVYRATWCRDCAPQKVMEYQRPTCVLCDERCPREEFMHRGRTTRVCNTCRQIEAREEAKAEAIDRVHGLVEYEPGTPGWRRLEMERTQRRDRAFEALRANREEVMGR